MPALQLAFAFWHIGAAMNQLDAEPRADILQGGGAIRGAVVDDQFAAYAALEHGLFEYAFDVERGLAETKRAVRDQARGIIEERDQIGFAPSTPNEYLRPVQDIAVPDIVRMGGEEAAPRLGYARGGGGSGESLLLQKPMNR